MANENVNIVIKAVDKTKKSFRAVTVGLNAIKKAAFSMQSALVAVGIAGFGFLVKKSMDATDALGKMADKIGINTAELGGLRYAAELTGVATNTLDMGLQRMVRRVSEAANGTGAAKNALIELGLSAEALNNLSPDEQFRAIADAMEGVAGQGEKVRLAMSLFDTEGVALVNTLKGGSAALKAMEQEAERLGLRMSRGLVQGVEKANDAIGTLTTYIANVFHRTVAEMAPAIEEATIALRKWAEESIQAAGGPKEFAKGVAVAFLNAGKAVVASTQAMLNTVIRVANQAGKAIQKLLDLLPSALPTIDKLDDDITAAGENVKRIATQLNALNGTTNQIKEDGLAVAMKELKILQEEKALGEYIQTFKPIELVNFDGALGQIDKLIAGVKAIQIDEKAKDVSQGDVAKVDLTASSINMDQLLQLQNAKYIILQDAKAEHEEKMLSMTHLYLRKQSAMQKAASANKIDTLQESGKKVVGALSSQYKWAFDLHKSFAIKDALIDTYKAVSSSFANAGGWPMGIGPAAVALAQGTANVQMLRSTSFREKGGPMAAGSPYIVGERGPELVVPSSASSVVPNDKLGGGGNVTINVTTNDASGFDDLLTRSRGTLLGLMNQALNENGRASLV